MSKRKGQKGMEINRGLLCEIGGNLLEKLVSKVMKTFTKNLLLVCF
jgi:hypothetical protein